MDDMNKKRDPKVVFIKVFVALAMLVYGGFSVYTLYLLTPERITSYTLVKVVFGLGGLVAGFVPIGLYLAIEDTKEEKAPRFLYTVYLALFSIPLLIYGAYLIKLGNLNAYSISNDRIKYKISGSCEAFDKMDPDSDWEVYFTDTDHNKIDDSQVYEIGKYDIISYIANLECNSYNIEDREYPAANYNSRTVQRVVAFYYGNDESDVITQSNDISVYDTGGNQIKVTLTATTERIIPVWDVILAKKSTKPNVLDKLDVLGKDCSNLSKTYWNYDGDIGIDDNVIVSSYDDDCRITIFDRLYTKHVAIDYFAENSGYFEAARIYTAEPLDDFESDEFYTRL